MWVGGASGFGLSHGALGQSLQVCDALGDALLLLKKKKKERQRQQVTPQAVQNWHEESGKKNYSFTVQNHLIKPFHHDRLDNSEEHD